MKENSKFDSPFDLPKVRIPDNRLVNGDASQEEILQCKICLNIGFDPIECVGCENLFCKSCIQDWLKKHNECPFKCPGEFKENRTNKVRRNALYQLKYKVIIFFQNV